MRRDRGVSTALSFALVIVITVTLTGGLVIGAEELVTNQREQAVQDQLEVIGERLATTVSTVDRFNETADTPSVANVTRPFPDRIAGAQYRIEVVDTAGPDRSELVLEAVDSDAEVSVTVRTSADLRTGYRLNGGTVRVAYLPDTEEIVIEHV